MAFCRSLGSICIVNTTVSLIFGGLVSGNLHGCFTAQGFLASPLGLWVDSVDYTNVLRWSPPLCNTTLNYSVQWKIYGESEWVEVEGCRGIQSLQCDLTKMTSKSREWYYARVHAYSTLPNGRSAWALSRRFNPHWDTKISPPTLNLTTTQQGILVRLRPTPALVRKLQKNLCCRIHLRHNSGEENIIEMKSCNKELVLNHLSAGTKYCLQAQCVVCLKGKTSSRTPPRCVTTLKRRTIRSLPTPL